ncbi:MAG: MFS transporter [Roseomonas sp.]|nr:MFS transporter [Roseomonas sp.]
MSSPHGLVLALFLLAGAQTLATMAVYALPVLVAYAAPDFGMPRANIGYQVGLVYLCAVFASAYGPRWLAIWGPARTTQIALLAAAMGVALLSFAEFAIAIPATILIGLAYGLTNPAASQLLGKLAPPSRRNMVFGLKQMGVPFGVALAGLMLPGTAEILGWRHAMLLAATMLLLMVIALQFKRRDWDQDRGAPAVQAGPLLLLKSPALCVIGLAAACYALVQIGLGAHMVAMLIGDYGWDSVSAGVLVGLCQVVGGLSRIGWALVADTRMGGQRALMLIGALSGIFLMMLPLVAGHQTLMLVLLFIAIGASTAGWNGVLVAESVRLAPPGAAGAASGAVISLSFAGAVLGPPLIAVLGQELHGYRYAFAVLAILPLAGAALCWFGRNARRGDFT